MYLKYFAFISMLTIINLNPIKAQNYNLIDTNKPQFFIAKNGTVNALNIEIAYLKNTDSLFYNYYTLQDTTPTQNNCTDNPTQNHCYCGVNVKKTWFSRLIIKKNNGDYILFNEKKDSIKIQSRANIGQKWTLMRLNPNQYFEAQTTAVVSQNVLGTTDSLKTIEITLKNNAGQTVSNPLNGKKIQISKNKGLIATLSFAGFPNDTSTITRIEPLYMTGKQVYDFDIGDVFQYHIDCLLPKYIHNTILKKQFNTNQDSVFYTIKSQSFTVNNNLASLGALDTFAVGIGALNDTLFRNFLPKQTIFNYNAGVGSSFTYHQDSRYNQRTYLEYVDDEYAINIINRTFFTDTCFGPNLLATVFTNLRYIKGAGRNYTQNAKPNAVCRRLELIYYKKGNETWGNNFLAIGIEQHTNTNKNTLLIYPNPAKTSIAVAINHIEHLQIYDMWGKNIIKIIQPDNQNIDVSNLEQGIYAIKAITRDGQSFLGKFVKQ